MSNYFNICPNCDTPPAEPGSCDCIDQKGRKIAKRQAQAQAIRDIENAEESEGKEDE